jgi:proteasome alpha subunit
VAALSGPERSLPAAELEVALLTRGNGRRCFQRLADEEVAAMLSAGEDAPS